MDADDIEEADAAIAAAAALIAAASRITVLTGAGISTAAGIPDFRGPHGLWTTNPGLERASNIHDYLTDETLRRAAWKRRIELHDRNAQPTVAHRSLVRLEHTGRLIGLATQNIDGLHHAAGSDPSIVFEVHGHNRTSHCVECLSEWATTAVLERVRAGDPDPRCTRCGGIVKPAVVYFGEPLPTAPYEAALRASESCDVLLAVGTTLAVRPINAMVPRAARAGARIIILNASDTDFDHIAELSVRGDIQQTLPAVLRA